MRKIDEIIIHCTATRPDWWATRSLNQKVAEVKKWHTSPPNNWADIGYHFCLDRDGKIAEGRPVEKAGAHTKGHNANSIGIALFGGFGSSADDLFQDNFTQEQEQALRSLILQLLERYGNLKISGHNEYANKACPGFRVKEWWSGRPAAKPMSKRTTGAVGIGAATVAVTQAETLVQSAASISDSLGVTTASLTPEAEHMNGLVVILAVALAAALGWLIYTRIKDTGRLL
jgi:hypothetical protein